MDSYPSLTGLAAAYRSGDVTPAEITRAHLDRIERLDAKIGAYQAVYAEDAMQAAEAATAAIKSGHGVGPFHGIPFALKDICDVQGRVTTGGSKVTENRVSPTTGTVAARLMGAGGVLLGKTKTVEYAYGAWGTNQFMGTPMNPWDLDIHRVPGGSSAGSGAAVGAGLAVCAVGTDTGGSVRMPSAFCGLTGLKVTEAQLPTDGIIPLSHTLDTPGPMARSVMDAAVMYLVMSGREGHAITQAMSDGQGLFQELKRGVRGLTLGVLPEGERQACTPEVLAAYDQALEVLKSQGATLTPFMPPARYADTSNMMGTLISVEGYFHHGSTYEDPNAPVDEDVRPRILAGRDLSAADYMRVLADRRRAIASALDAMVGIDAIVTPTTTMAAIPVAEADQANSPAHFTRTVNYLAMCALALPMEPTPVGLPTSLQIAARGGDEAMALRIGAAFEQDQPPRSWPEI